MQSNIIKPHDKQFILINDRINNLYNTYLFVICPFIAQLERTDNKFPIAILNEIRAIATHLGRLNLSNDINVINDNLTKAERHIKRTVLDCFKYSCLSLEDNYQKFERLYRRADLSIVDNGEFLPNLTKMRIETLRSLKEAQSYEITENCSEDELFKKYELAYNNYAEVDSYINDSMEKLERARHKGIKNDFFAIAGFAVGIIGIVFSIISIIL